MSKDDQQPIDSLEEDFVEPTDSIEPENDVSASAEKTSEDSDTLNLDDIRTAGF